MRAGSSAQTERRLPCARRRRPEPSSRRADRPAVPRAATGFTSEPGVDPDPVERAPLDQRQPDHPMQPIRAVRTQASSRHTACAARGVRRGGDGAYLGRSRRIAVSSFADDDLRPIARCARRSIAAALPCERSPSLVRSPRRGQRSAAAGSSRVPAAIHCHMPALPARAPARERTGEGVGFRWRRQGATPVWRTARSRPGPPSAAVPRQHPIRIARLAAQRRPNIERPFTLGVGAGCGSRLSSSRRRSTGSKVPSPVRSSLAGAARLNVARSR